MSWTVVTGPNFPKDLASLPVKLRGRVATFAFDVLPATENPFQLGKLVKMKDYEGFYKVRFGSYRLGLLLDAKRKRIHLLRVMHRRDIYRHFP